MSSSNFASFAPYTPPPDDPSHPSASSSKPPPRPWFPSHTSSHAIDNSYQSGGIPTFNASAGGGLGAVEEADTQQNQWETRYGMRVDVLAALAYFLGPVFALALLIIETQNDYVRFHAYQSALMSTPMLVVRITLSLLNFPSWMRTLFTLLILGSEFYMMFRAYRDASQNGLSRYQLPVIGAIADQWLRDE